MITAIKDVIKKFFQILVRYPLHLSVFLLWFTALQWGINFLVLNYQTVSQQILLIGFTLTALVQFMLVSVLVDLVENRAFSLPRVISRFTLFRIINYLIIGSVISLPLLLIGILILIVNLATDSSTLLSSTQVNQFATFGNLLFITPLATIAQAAIIKDNLRVDIALDRSLSLLFNNILAIVVCYALLAAPSLLAGYVVVPSTLLTLAHACLAIAQSLIGVIIYVNLSKRS